MLTEPTPGELTEILRRADPGCAAELDAFHGAGLWTPEGEAARLLGQRNLLAHVMRDGAGAPRLAFGAFLVRFGVARTWLVAARGWTDTVARALPPMHATLVRIALEGPVHRVEVVSLAGRPRVRPWFEQALGYSHEGLERRAGAQGEDFDRYSIIRGEG